MISVIDLCFQFLEICMKDSSLIFPCIIVLTNVINKMSDISYLFCFYFSANIYSSEMSGLNKQSSLNGKIISYGNALSKSGDALNKRYEMKRQTSTTGTSTLNRPAGLMRQTSGSYGKRSGTSV